ncbi:transglutaminase-like domain-containing protein [Bauldia litoralis]|uniref:transglutaminase-like domain-containing protein n=1 Tax=Bauldia litoralis TaxID=665467 RepID=UPI003266AB13
MHTTVTVTVATEDAAGRLLLAPVGIATPHQTPVRFTVEGAPFSLVGEAGTGQMAALIAPRAGTPVTLTYDYVAGGPGYAEALFGHRPNRYTIAADSLVDGARRIATADGGEAGIAAIAQDVAAKFTYGHPERRFYDGHDHIPDLACGVAEGSCVDINAYLIACLRAAGFEAGYVTGYFFPAEKHGRCDDMHCWVVTRHAGVVREWDIAHHLKLGEPVIRPGLNPKPGERVALAHSMGLDFPDAGIRALKLLAEPVWLDSRGRTAKTLPLIQRDRLAGKATDERRRA